MLLCFCRSALAHDRVSSSLMGCLEECLAGKLNLPEDVLKIKRRLMPLVQVKGMGSDVTRKKKLQIFGELK